MREPVPDTPAAAAPSKLRFVAGVIAFGAGAAFAAGAFLWRRKVAELDDAPAFIALAGAALGSLGSLLVQVAYGLMAGKSLQQAAGVDESRKSSKVTLVMAGLLFVPLWAASLAMVVTSIAPGTSMQRLMVWSLIAAFLTLLVFGLVREWRR